MNDEEQKQIMDNAEMEPFAFGTGAMATELEAWKALGKYLEEKGENGWLWLRVAPLVESEINFDTKKEAWFGFVRGGIFPTDFNTLHIPGLGG
jgi:hypothetical protein